MGQRGSDHSPQKGRRQRTGFVFEISGKTRSEGMSIKPVPASKHVLTNYHVIKQHNRDMGPIRVFFYDCPEEVDVEERVADFDEKYYSRDPKDSDDEKCYDFAVLNVNDIPSRAKGINLMASIGRHTAVFSKKFFKAIQEILPSEVVIHQGIIVGHPLGKHKRISIVDFTLDGDDNEEEDDDAMRAYSKDGTQPGSSGSPVMIK